MGVVMKLQGTRPCDAVMRRPNLEEREQKKKTSSSFCDGLAGS